MPLREFNVFRTVGKMRQYVKERRRARANQSFGLVPTMGALHDGHLALVKAAARENTEVVVSIYVNPTQFGANEDLSSYPRTFESDLEKLSKLRQKLQQDESSHGDVTTIFAPTTKEMYPTMPPTSEPDGDGSFVSILPMGRLLEGASRPGFFRGVATVCMKLFNIVSADRAYFGQKDGQQAALIRRMVRDLHVDTEIKVLPTTRESDGLAMSSRNVYLGARRRKAAALFPQMLETMAARYIARGECDAAAIKSGFNLEEGKVTWARDSHPLVAYKIDYVSVADLETMEEVSHIDPARGAMLSAAMVMLPITDPQPDESFSEAGEELRSVRLIDNIILPPIT